MISGSTSWALTQAHIQTLTATLSYYRLDELDLGRSESIMKCVPLSTVFPSPRAGAFLRTLRLESCGLVRHLPSLDYRSTRVLLVDTLRQLW